MNNNKDAFKLILDGLENCIITKNKQKRKKKVGRLGRFEGYINELPASLLLIKSTIKTEFNFYLDILGRHSFNPYGTKKSKKVQINLDDTVYSIYLAEKNF